MKEPGWKIRLQFLAGSEKTPERIAKDVVLCLLELEKLFSLKERCILNFEKRRKELSEKFLATTDFSVQMKIAGKLGELDEEEQYIMGEGFHRDN